jgi:hypothetical protein
MPMRRCASVIVCRANVALAVAPGLADFTIRFPAKRAMGERRLRPGRIEVQFNRLPQLRAKTLRFVDVEA